MTSATHTGTAVQGFTVAVLCLPCRRACYGVLRFVMESNAKGCEVGDLLNKAWDTAGSGSTPAGSAQQQGFE